jgi:hypothetical protein
LQAAQLRVVTSQRDAMSAVQCVSLVQATQLPSVGEPAVMSQARPAASPGHCASETHCTQRPALSKHAAVGAWQVVSSIHSAQRLVVVLHASVALPLVVVPAQCDASRHCTHWFVSVLQTGVELGLEESWHSALAWQRSVHVPLAASHTGVSGGQSVSPKQAWQLLLPTLQNGVGAWQCVSFVHWTQRPSASSHNCPSGHGNARQSAGGAGCERLPLPPRLEVSVFVQVRVRRQLSALPLQAAMVSSSAAVNTSANTLPSPDIIFAWG